MIWLRRIALMAVVVVAACSSVSTVRVQPEHIYVGPNMRPIAVIHAQATRGYILFIPLGSPVNLDLVVNRMLLATAKALGADKVVNITVDITPDDGIWTVLKIAGWRSARASGVAVIVDEPAATPPATATSKP